VQEKDKEMPVPPVPTIPNSETIPELDQLLADPNLLATEREAITRLLAVSVALEALAGPSGCNASIQVTCDPSPLPYPKTTMLHHHL
jgi:hypothetical protein